METGFVAILQKLVAEQGKEALLDAAKCKALLPGYTRDEYKKESHLLLQALEAGVQNAIDGAQDIEPCKKQQIRVLREEYSLAEERAAAVVDTLVLVLKREKAVDPTGMACPVCGTIAEEGATKCVNCGFTDKPEINRKFPIRQDFQNWFDTVVKPYRIQWEAKKREAELLAQIEELKEKVQALTQQVPPPPPPPSPVPDDFVRVDGGTFTMGSSDNEPGRKDDEVPQHQVTVSGFYMGKYQVTQKEYQEVMGINPSHFKGDNLPVEQVSWHDAVEYCNKRSLREGLTPAYRGSGKYITCDWSANGYRLPTEAEWEFAAKGGTKDSLTTLFPGSNNEDAVAWYKENSRGSIHPVGTKAANSLGIYDMSGNVWEWCWDWYETYSSGAQTDPRGPSLGGGRVMRGGGSNNTCPYMRSAYRTYNNPSVRNQFMGFRLVRS